MLSLRGIICKQTERVKICSLARSLQNFLDVGKLSVCCATQQLRAYPCVVASERLSSAEHLSPAHLSLVRPFTTLLHCNTTLPDKLSVRAIQPMFTVVRFRRRKMIRKPDAPEPSAEDEVGWALLVLVE